MATRSFPVGADVVCDVETKDGRGWVGCDTYNHSNESTVAFWADENTLMLVPLRDIYSIKVYERKKDSLTTKNGLV